MPTQVRVFTVPKPLGETLAAPTPTPFIPRSVPIYPDIPKSSGTLPWIKPNTMAVYQDKAVEGGITFAHQDKLKKLPIPELEGTCKKYLAALKPLQSSREHSETKHAVQEFLRSDGVELQEKLKKYAEERTSYIEQFCMFCCSAPVLAVNANRLKGTTRT